MTKQSSLEIIVGVVAAILAIVALVLWSRAVQTRYEMVAVPRASAAIKAPHTILGNDIELVSVPNFSVPDSVIRDRDKLIGTVLTRDVASQMWFTNLDLVSGRDASSDSALVPAGASGVTLPAGWFAGILPRVRPNDIIDIYAVAPRSGANQTSASIVIRSPVLRIDTNKSGDISSLFIAVAPATVGRIAEAKAAQYIFLASAVSIREGSATSTH